MAKSRGKSAGGKVSAPAFSGPIGRAQSTFSDSALAGPRGPLGPASAPNTPDGTQPDMAY
jgi:hypothetical protein